MQISYPQATDETASIFLLGLNHRTTPLALREQMALTADETRQALAQMTGGALEEVVVLGTCNRLEIYGVAADVEQGQAAVAQWLSHLRGVPLEHLRQYLYYETGHAAITHLMRVSAGVDSTILGEAQILGQVGQAFASAQAAGAAGPVLSHLFTLATHAGKRARSETDISRHITSVSHAAVFMAHARLANLKQATALVVGSGEMAYLAAQALHRHDVTTIRCINRSYARAVDLARTFDGEALDWYRLPEALAEADVVITATSAPHTVIQARDVELALAGRLERPLVVIDIAMPRDVEAQVRNLPGVHYYDLDDLNTFVEANVARREEAIAGVEAIIGEEAARFLNWYRGRSLAPVISALRERATLLAQDEVEAALRRLGDLDENQQHVVELMAHRIVSKILHEPTTRLKNGAAGDQALHYASVVRDLFALDEGAEKL